MIVAAATTATAYQTNLLVPALTGGRLALCFWPRSSLLAERPPASGPTSVSVEALVSAPSPAGIGGGGADLSSFFSLVISPAFTSTQTPARLQTRTTPANTITFMVSSA